MANKAKNIRLATLFNMVRLNPSKEVEDYIVANKLDPNTKNENLKISLLTSINNGMMESNTYNKSNENALFVLNNIADPYYVNFRGNFDILETYILNQYKYKKVNFLDDAIYNILFNRYHSKNIDLQQHLFTTIENLIHNDKNKTIIPKAISNFLYNISNLDDVIFGKLKPNMLKLLEDNGDDLEEKKDNVKILIKDLIYNDKIIDVIFLYINKYNDNNITKLVLPFFNEDGTHKKEFSTVLFKPLIYLSNTSLSIKQQQIIHNVFDKLDIIQFPLTWDSLDESSKNTLNEIKFKHPKIHADILQYILKSNMYIKTKNRAEISEIGNNNLRKIRL